MIRFTRETDMSKLKLRIFDGTRQIFAATTNFLITIIDGNQKQLYRGYRNTALSDFDLPFYDNFGNNSP